MKKILFMLIGILVFAGCDEKEGCYPPTYKGFRIEPTTVFQGDSITITAVQQKKGNYLNATDYTWSINVKVNKNGTDEDLALTYKRHTNYGGTDNSDPVWGARLPENIVPGAYTCSFQARFSNSADGIGGSFASEGGDGYTGSITSYSYTLYSEAKGSFRFNVLRKQ